MECWLETGPPKHQIRVHMPMRSCLVGDPTLAANASWPKARFSALPADAKNPQLSSTTLHEGCSGGFESPRDRDYVSVRSPAAG